jgi:6-phosphogluconolactonase
VVQQECTSVNPDRQEGPHAHMILASPDNTFVFAADLGADRIFGYRLDQESGALIPVPEAGGVAEPGAGPRHFAFSPDGGSVYVINELNGTLAVYDYDRETGAFTAHQVLTTLPADWTEEPSCAHVLVSPDGRYVYGSNRGHDSIAIFLVSADTGEVTPEEIVTSGGKTPRNFALSPDADGRWLLAANMDSDNVVVWPRNVESGYPEGDGAPYDIPSACCLVFAGE